MVKELDSFSMRNLPVKDSLLKLMILHEIFMGVSSIIVFSLKRDSELVSNLIGGI